MRPSSRTPRCGKRSSARAALAEWQHALRLAELSLARIEAAVVRRCRGRRGSYAAANNRTPTRMLRSSTPVEKEHFQRLTR